MESTDTAHGSHAARHPGRRQSPRSTAAAPAPASADVADAAALYLPIAEPLQQVERRLHRELESPHPLLAPVLRHGVLLGGKRLRPALVLLAAAATGRIRDAHLTIGTVVEMVHTATLIHDDVLDGATHRRHQMTVNARWDRQTSILLGDYLFAQSFSLAATLDSTDACRWIGEASRRVCEGELRQVLQRDDAMLDEAAYLDIIRGKTAELCGVACRLGAAYAGAASADVDRLARYGESIGIAFQIADDLLDLWGDDNQVGKTLGTDLLQGKLTLPLIRLLSAAPPTLRCQVQRILAGPPDERLRALLPLLEASDARSYTRQRAEHFVARAVACLEPLADTAARAALLQIARFAIDRRA